MDGGGAWPFGCDGSTRLAEPKTAPDLLLPEFAHVLRKKALRGEASWAQAHDGLQTLSAVIERFTPSIEISSEALILSKVLDHSAYDCHFLAVAFGRGVLVTADDVFARKCAAAGFGAFVFQLGDTEGSLLAKTTTLNLPPAINLDELSRLAKVVQSTVTSLYNIQREANPGKLFISTSTIAPAFGSPAYIQMTKLMASLTEEQLSAVLATAWLGRDYSKPRDWPQLLANARRTAKVRFNAESSYILAQMNDLSAGLEKLRAMGLT